MQVDRTSAINTRGCRDLMYSWYRAGFIENIIMAVIGLFIGAFEFYLYTLNRNEYYKLLDEIDDMRKPMMNTTMSMSTINSKMSGGGVNSGHLINFGPQSSASRFTPVQKPSMSGNTPSIGGSSIGIGHLGPGVATSSMRENSLPQLMNANNPTNSSNDYNYSNPLQSIQNMSGRFGFRNKPTVSTPSDRYLINDSDQIN